MKKIVFIVSSPLTIKAFLSPFIKALAIENEVHIIANFSEREIYDFIPKRVTLHAVSLERNPNILVDMFALFSICKLIRKHKFNIVHTFTPKAGLIGQVSAFLTGVRFRFHTFTGQVWATKKGPFRFVLRLFDKLIGVLASFSLVDSPSQREFLIKNNVLSSEKSAVLGKGSISGINLEKFKYSEDRALNIRAKLNLKNNEFVYLYAGRLKVDKGIPELFTAFDLVSKNTNSVLVIVGVDEDNLLQYINNSQIIFCGFANDITSFFSMADLLCLPSHREGFGNVILEAAACGLPSLATNIYGLTDAIIDGETGMLHEVSDVSSLASHMNKLQDNKEELHRLGNNARARVRADFSEEFILGSFLDFYKSNTL